jgi:hypothetical protein
MWSKELTELSEEYLNYTGTHLKHIKGKFGILDIDYKTNTYTISIKPGLTEKLVFNSVDDIIKSGWAVD